MPCNEKRRFRGVLLKTASVVTFAAARWGAAAAARHAMIWSPISTMSAGRAANRPTQTTPVIWL